MSARTFRNLLGLVEDRLKSHLGVGPQLIFDNLSQSISARNANDTAFLVGRGADPVSNDDWVTLRHFNAEAQGAVREIRFSLNYNNWPGPVNSVTLLPAGSFVISTQANITTAFDAGTTIEVQGPGAAILLAASNIYPSTQGIYGDLAMDHQITTSAPVQAVLGGNPTVGDASVIVRYVVPQP